MKSLAGIVFPSSNITAESLTTVPWIILGVELLMKLRCLLVQVKFEF